MGASALPQPVIDLLGAAFPGAALGAPAATFGGFSHHTALLTISEQRCVVKAADTPAKRADVRRDACMLELLRDTGLPAPTLIKLIEVAPWTVAVQPAITGTHGLHVLVQALADQELMCHALGETLAAIHRTELARPAGTDWLLAERSRRALAALPGLALDAALCDELRAALEHPAWRPAVPCLVHGDAGAHNLLWDGRISAILDWEWSGWGNPLLDLAWVYWTMRWRNVADRLWQVFLAGYGRDPQSGGADGALRALALGQIAGLLIRTQDQPDAFAEWLRRGRWTLALPVPF